MLLTSALAGFAQAQTVTLNSAPSRGVGQPQLFPESGSANRVEGREFFSPQGVALDNTTSSTPILYVADLRNNRVLAWKNSTGFGNGAPADLVIGQPDMFSTSALGPGTLYPTGLTAPTGIAVYKGDLYVADAGNNRVLRYPKPFSQQGPITPDLWIGQPNLNSRTANWTGQVSEKGVFLSSSNNVFQSGIAFDASGNLWIGDPGNVRVLRYPAGSITCSSCTASADIVIGQPNLTTVTTPPLPSTLTGFKTKNQFGLIDALAFDSTGRLYVTDQVGSGSTANGRVLVFSSPSSQTGNLSADRIMGVIDISQLSGLDQNALQVFEGQTFLLSPGGVFLLADNSVGVVDTTLNRITIFPPYEQWPAESKYFSPQASSVIGQTGFLVPGNTFPNAVGPGFSSAGTPPPSASTLYGPTSAVFLPATKELFISDSTNNRVIVMPQTTGTNFGAGTRVLGQDKMTQYSINLIEGKEFNFFVSQSYGDAAIALDTSGPAPHLWVSDPHNHRVLGFADARKLGPATKADIVLGQPDFGSALCNYPSGDVNSPSQSSLCLPTGLAVDAGGNLYVADSLNGRVLRFPNPWAYTGPAPEPADLVLGQSNFNNSVRQPTASTMGSPYGLAFSGTSGLVVADPGYNRIVFIPFSANGTFTAGLDNGKAATKFFGQPDFKTITSGSATNQLNGPRGIACDTSGQIYVADANNNRVEIFGDPNNPQTTAFANLTLPSLNSPRSIYVNSGTGEIWVTNTGAGTLVRYPKYDALFLNPAPTATIQDVLNNTLIPTYAVAQDQYGDLVVADAANHVIAFYQGFTAVNAATSLARPLAP
ncbi:MAG TPA: NHL repeat-containing protein, partial [Candidatus Sulfopaludibacter sp.]|nr:NHL repeat-containing protein [Candidatus Sulfopaludibacter sp.]